MLKIAQVPVKTRLPLTAWVLAALVTLFSIMSSALHTPGASDRAMPSAEQVPMAKIAHEAKI
jgi:hypothetical protein